MGRGDSICFVASFPFPLPAQSSTWASPTYWFAPDCSRLGNFVRNMSKIRNNENYVCPMEPHANSSYVCLFDHGGWRRVIYSGQILHVPPRAGVHHLAFDCNFGYFKVSEKPGYLWLSSIDCPSGSSGCLLILPTFCVWILCKNFRS